MFGHKRDMDDWKVRKSISKRVGKKFYRMLKYLDKKDVCYGTTLAIWEDELADDYRFIYFPQLWEGVNRFWDKDIAPLVVELIYAVMGVHCYRNQMRNLLGMYLCEVDASYHDKKRVWELTTLLYLALELNPELGGDIHYALEKADSTYYQTMRKMTKRICGDDWARYYKQVVEPIALGIFRHGAGSKYFKEQTVEGTIEILQCDDDLDEEVVRFLVEDAWDYVEAGDCFQYNPFWLFGAEHYEAIMRRFRGVVEKILSLQEIPSI